MTTELHKGLTQSVMAELRCRGCNWRTMGAVVGLCGGFAAVLIASILTVETWVSAWHVLALQRLATALFIVTIPLLIFGSHCMDCLDEKRK